MTEEQAKRAIDILYQLKADQLSKELGCEVNVSVTYER